MNNYQLADRSYRDTFVEAMEAAKQLNASFVHCESAVVYWPEDWVRVPRCCCYRGHNSSSGRCNSRNFYRHKDNPVDICGNCLNSCDTKKGKS